MEQEGMGMGLEKPKGHKSIEKREQGWGENDDG
jgi:hypothetical protein